MYQVREDLHLPGAAGRWMGGQIGAGGRSSDAVRVELQRMQLHAWGTLDLAVPEHGQTIALQSRDVPSPFVTTPRERRVTPRRPRHSGGPRTPVSRQPRTSKATPWPPAASSRLARPCLNGCRCGQALSRRTGRGRRADPVPAPGAHCLPAPHDRGALCPAHQRTARLVRIEELVFLAAERVPGLGPLTSASAGRPRAQAERQRRLRVDQGLFLSQVLSHPPSGAHLVHAMLRPRGQTQLRMRPNFSRPVGSTSARPRLNVGGRVGYLYHGNPSFLNAEDDSTTSTLEIGVD